MQGIKSTAMCREKARAWAEAFSEHEGKYAANFECLGDKKVCLNPNMHKYSGSPAQLDGKSLPVSAILFTLCLD